jgi:catechol 2,3-dioxygenase-like lactoylglutathione lyase family enzyme
MGNILGLDAVVLIVKNLEAQKRFYHDLLGLEITSDYGDAVSFSCGSVHRGYEPNGSIPTDNLARRCSKHYDDHLPN